MILYNVKVIKENDRYKAEVPGTKYKAVCTSFYELQVRLYDLIDREDNEKKDYRLIFLLTDILNEH
jgi:hypothetical protein